MKLIQKIKEWLNKNKSIKQEEDVFMEIPETHYFKNYYDETDFNDLFEEGFTELKKVNENTTNEYKYVLYNKSVYKIPVFKDYFNYKGLKCKTNSDSHNIIVLSNYENETLIILNEETQLILYYMLKEKFKL